MATLVVIGGPTAVGKTSVSIAVAKHFNTEIISADSRQFYRDMLIGTARPTPEEMDDVPHHFVGHLALDEPLTAGQYEEQVLELLDRLFQQHEVVILTGGSGLFLDAVTKGIDPLPAASDAIREALNEQLETEGLASLVTELQEKDPAYAAQADLQNPRRVLRALEVIRQTGKSYSEQRKGEPAQRSFHIVKVCLNRDRAELYARIDHRVDLMLEAGLEAEVKSLLPYQHLNSLRTVGYRELFDHLNGKTSREEAVELIKRNSRRYAKRQLTWFRKDPEYQWFSPEDQSDVVEYIRSQIS